MQISTGRLHDPFQFIQAMTDVHRESHACWAYPFQDGPSLGVLAAATGARRILELGTALGYTACWLAHGSPRAMVDTIERDAEHVRLARDNIAGAGLANRITVHHGDFGLVLPTLVPGYDIAFFDGYAPTLTELNALEQALHPGGMLISANLSLSEGGGQECIRALCDPNRWLTSFMIEGGRTAVSIRRHEGVVCLS